MPPFLKQKRIWIPALCALLVVVYALVGFLWAPVLLRNALIGGLHDQLGLKPSVGEIRINPFLLQLEVKDFTLPDRQGAKLLGFQRLFVDFETSSLWRRAYVFKDIDITAPYANASISHEGHLNFDDLKPRAAAAPAPPPEPKAAGTIPRIEIGVFRLTRGAAGYEDHSRVDPIVLNVDPIGFELTNFTTGAEGGAFTFSGVSKRGGRLAWQGHFSLQPLSSDGTFRIDEVRARSLWEYVEHNVGFVVADGAGEAGHPGLIGLAGNYRFRLAQRPELQAHLDGLTVKDLALGPSESENDWIRLGALEVGATDLDLAKRTVRIAGVSLDALKVRAWRERDGAINLLRLAHAPGAGGNAPAGSRAADTAAPAAQPPATQPPAPQPAATQPPAAQPSASSGWDVQLAQFAVRGAAFDAEDRAITPAVRVTLAPFNLTVRNLSQDLHKPLAVALDTGINEKGRFETSGSVVPVPLQADLDVKLGHLGLAVAQPYLAQQTALTLQSGELGASGKLQVQVPADRQAKPPLSLHFAGEAAVDGLRTLDNQVRQDLVSWHRVQVRGIDFRLGPDRLDIAQVLINKLYARVVVLPDRTLNVSRVMAGPHAQPPGAVTPAEDGGGTQDKVPAEPQAHAVRTAAVTPANSGAPPMMPINVHKVVLQASTLNFTDLSLKPNFSAGINALGGSITGLSSRPGTRAKIDLKGQVDTFSPVSITGEANVLGPLYTDIAMSFRNMELTTFNPYSGKFAGYNISKGKLTTELTYKIDGRKLDAGHHIIIDQLEFGAKTDSKDAVSLPVKLAVALLKDRKGVIDLDLPVTGSLDDPHFRLGPVIWKVVMNLLVKIVTSPFALLGSLFGGGADLQYVDFPAGSATLDAAAQGRVKNIAKALAERPQLKIAVPLATVAELDRPALVEQRLAALLRERQQGKAASNAATGAPDLPAFDTLPPKRQLELLGQVYRDQSGHAPEFPKAAESPAAADAGGTAAPSKEQKQAADIAWLRQQLLGLLKVEDPQLTELAKARAAAIQALLLEGTQIDPARVFLVANNKAKAEQKLVRYELSLE
ncbi:MAG: DUF748 domain-containing protein [Steroidobacteraceae bacterium]